MYIDFSFIFVFFGGIGDLLMCKILFVLFEVYCVNMLVDGGWIVVVVWYELDWVGYFEWVDMYVKLYVVKVVGNVFDDVVWKLFFECIEYVKFDFGCVEDYVVLCDVIVLLFGICVFYFVIGLLLFVLICKVFVLVGLNEGLCIVFEKLFGYDLKLLNVINDVVGEIFVEG